MNLHRAHYLLLNVLLLYVIQLNTKLKKLVFYENTSDAEFDGDMRDLRDIKYTAMALLKRHAGVGYNNIKQLISKINEIQSELVMYYTANENDIFESELVLYSTIGEIRDTQNICGNDIILRANCITGDFELLSTTLAHMAILCEKNDDDTELIIHVCERDFESLLKEMSSQMTKRE